MRMREIISDGDDLAALMEDASVKLSDLRKGAPLTLRSLNALKKVRAVRRLAAAERRDFLPRMYGDAEPDADDLKIEKSELDVHGKRLANAGKALDVRRKKDELDGASTDAVEVAAAKFVQSSKRR